jgi:hypothetical protein
MFRDMMDFLRLPRLSDSQRPLGSRAPAGIRPPSPMGILAAARMGAALTMLFLVPAVFHRQSGKLRGEHMRAGIWWRPPAMQG